MGEDLGRVTPGRSQSLRDDAVESIEVFLVVTPDGFATNVTTCVSAPRDTGNGVVLVFICGVPSCEIRRIGVSELELLEPLWNALREHHSSVTPELGAPRSRRESWLRRRRQYQTWLANPDSFLLLAERQGDQLGYAMVQVQEGSPTWPLSERTGEIETLSVLPGERGKGTGTALLEAVRKELGSRGITELSLHVMHTNNDAIRFYKRHGFDTYALWIRTKSDCGDTHPD
jgi:ribosomal protein S18 acetylase RimI-like enzyme